uniref:Uncharacterized protein n=1 Tax=Arundo donax TaxID=35708 RepID=A0A0A8ZJD6_ARUDO
MDIGEENGTVAQSQLR